MFERLAQIRDVVPWLKGLLSEPVCSQPIQSNDDRPGFRHPEGRRLRPHRPLACHWVPAPDGRLECWWEPAAADDQPNGNQDWPPPWVSPPLVPGMGQMTALEQIAV